LKNLEAKFDVEGVQKGGARFDYEKARWINHHYVIEQPTEELIQNPYVLEILKEFPKEKYSSIVALVKERLYTLKDLEQETAFLKTPYDYDEKGVAKVRDKNPVKVLEQICILLERAGVGGELKEQLFHWAKEEGVPLGVVMQSFRLSLVGALSGPDLFEVCALLGKDVSLKRVQNFINYLT
jgi:glutamyl-tRNA synthetase